MRTSTNGRQQQQKQVRVQLSADSNAGGGCQRVIRSEDRRMGYVKAPAATVPAGSTCTYTFKARKDERVWITFLSYQLQSLQPPKEADGQVGRLGSGSGSLGLVGPIRITCTMLG